MPGLNFVMLHVPNLDEAREFYTRTIGLDVESEQPGFLQFRNPDGNGAIFAVAEHPDAQNLAGGELWWMVEDADATYEGLVARGAASLTPPHNEDFGRAFEIRDPSGHTLRFFQPPSRH